MKPTLLALVLLLAASCTRGATRETTPSDVAGELFLVVEDGEAGRRTHVVSADGTLVRTLEGATLIATSNDVFHATSEHHEQARPSCAELEPDSGTTLTEAGLSRTIELVFVGLQDGRRIEAVDAASDPRATSLDQSLSIDGVLGPYVLGREQRWQYSCGAHGSSEVEAYFVDLEHGAVLRGSAYPLPAIPVAGFEAAGSQLVAESDGMLASDDVEPSLLTPTALLPGFSDGRFFVRLQLTVDACYACSDDRWSSYTRSTRIHVQTPSPFVELPAYPAAVAAFVRRHPGTIGVSWTRTDVALRALSRLP